MADAPSPFEDFSEATQAVLADLRRRHGMALWMLTRTVEDDWIVLEAEGDRYGVERGRVFRWGDTLCVQMVAGNGPRATGRAAEIEAYASAPIAEQMTIGTYIGVPLLAEDGTLFGTLCAMDPAPQDRDLEPVAEEVEILGRLLMTVMTMERRLRVERARAERARSEARVDPLTGMANRRGWDDVVDREEHRCSRYGDPAGVIVIDLEDLEAVNDTHGQVAGDEMLKLTAQTISASVRTVDVVARLGGDEFAVLATATMANELEALAHRIDSSLAKVGIRAALGWARRDPRQGLRAAQVEADAAMVEAVQQRRAAGHSDGEPGGSGAPDESP